MTYRVEDKVVVITGAGAGIGRATAHKLAGLGARVVVTDINVAGLNETASTIAENGGQVWSAPLDVVSEAAWSEVLEQASAHFGGIDVLVNNAGIYQIAPLLSISLDQWNQLMAINVTGVFLGARTVVPYLQQRGGGSIINMSSIGGLQGAFGHSLYGASKGAVRLLTKNLAAELGPDNIRVNSVHPTYVNTAMFQYAANLFGMPEAELAPKMSPLGRIATTEDVANMIAFLAGDDASFLSGSEFLVDGAGASSKML